MEFLPYQDALATLEGNGVHVVEESDLVRLELRSERAGSMPMGDVVHIVVGPNAASEASDGEHAVAVSLERVGEAIESIVHAAHLSEAVMIPAGQWRDVLDLVAFSLAGDEDWSDIDAEAALHQNSRDPLGLHQRQRHVVGKLVSALLENATDPRHGLSITALDAPIVIEIRSGKPVRVSCIGEEIASSLIESLKVIA